MGSGGRRFESCLFRQSPFADGGSPTAVSCLPAGGGMFRGLCRFYSCGRRVGLFTAGLAEPPVPFYQLKPGSIPGSRNIFLRQIQKNEEGMWMLRFVIATVLVALLALPVK